jgi:DNA-binding protein HU-beta
MNKGELVAGVRARSNLDREESERAVEAFFETIAASLADGDDVRFVGFGSFLSQRKPETMGRNPRTGEKICIPAHNIPRFRPGKLLKDAIN